MAGTEKNTITLIQMHTARTSSSPSPMTLTPASSSSSSACSASCVRSLAQWSIKRIFRMIPSIFLMLFVVSLLFVTLMQIVVIHSDRKILLSYSWRNGVSSISSSLISNVTTSSSMLKQMIRGLNYSSDPRHRDPKGLKSRGAGNASTQSMPAAAASAATTTTTVKKKPDVLRIEALLDRSLPSRDVNVKVLQNFVNSARIKEIIHLLQDRGALDSSPDPARQNVTLIWNRRHDVQSLQRGYGIRNPDSGSQQIRGSRGEEITLASRIEGSKERDAHAFRSVNVTSPAAAVLGMQHDHPAADDRDPSIRSLSHQTGSSRRSSATAAGAASSEHAVGNLDHGNAQRDEQREREESVDGREKGNQGTKSQRPTSVLSSSSSSSSSSSTSSFAPSSSQGNQEIDFPPEDRGGNLPEASVIVNSTGRQGISDSVPSPSSSSLSSSHADAPLHEEEKRTSEGELISFWDHDGAEDYEGNQGFNEANFTSDNLPPDPRMRGSNTSLIDRHGIASSRQVKTSLFQQLMSDPSNKTICSAIPPNLTGRILINMEPVIGENMSAITHMNPKVSSGGHFAPSSCYPRHRVAIIIPYRDRWEHLSILLYHLHPILQRQQLEYKIYVAEQFGNETFNKGVLMNAGVREALREADYHCFVFHDVDLIPEDDRNLYSCPISPRHMSYAVDKFNYTLPYNYLVGGVFAISKENLIQVNGYSNLYWGWGAEDDDMSHRYTMIKHNHRTESPSSVRQALLRMAKRRASRDGLSSVRYTIRSKIQYPLYTHLMIEIGHIHKWHFPSPNKLVLHF